MIFEKDSHLIVHVSDGVVFLVEGVKDAKEGLVDVRARLKSHLQDL